MGFFQRRASDPYLLVIGMTGVKMGDRLLQIGCAHGGRLGALAAKVGLSGRAVVVAPDQESANRARKGAAAAGVLVEVETALPTKIPGDDDSFDLVVVDNSGGLLGLLRPYDIVRMNREVLRLLRPAGRVVVIGIEQRGGFGAIISRAQAGAPLDLIPILQADGFRAVRTLAERDGLTFVEGVKPSEPRAEV